MRKSEKERERERKRGKKREREMKEREREREREHLNLFHPCFVFGNGVRSIVGTVVDKVVPIGPLAMGESKDMIDKIRCPLLGRRAHRIHPPIVSALSSLKLSG